LAQQYFKDGEYEKAAELYNKLYEKNNKNDYYFKYYFNSLINLGDYDSAEKAIKSAIRDRSKDYYLLARYGGLLEKKYENEKAEDLYKKSIKKLDENRNQIIQLANAFQELAKYDYALEVYEKGTDLLKDESVFAANLASLYMRTGDQKNMIKYYLIYGSRGENTYKYIKQVIQKQLSDSLAFELRNQLYAKIQEEPEQFMYVDLLAWVFVQEKNYAGALRQLISLDKRLAEDGRRVFELAGIAEKDKDFETAIKALEYLTEEKSINSPFYLDAKRMWLTSLRNKLNTSVELPREELLKIQTGYKETLKELGKNNQTALLSHDFAEFEAFYMNDLSSAIGILSEMVERTGLNDRLKAKAKLSLGDYYLMTGEIWEGSLLYSQVDKDFQEGFLGELARFKNARLSYFNGDFEWSKIQLDVLKASTSKLISNDAIDLAVFISENIGLDTTTIPLQMYASAELSALQNKYDEAFLTLDSIALIYPDHELEDDIWYLKANIYSNQKDFEKAVGFYQKVIDKHADDIRGDNAMYELAQLYENVLNQKEKAIAIYETIFIDFSNSTFAIEARKRYRVLTE